MSAGAAGATASGTAPTLTQIYTTIYMPKCSSCHAMAASDNANGKLGMIRSQDQLHQALVGKPAQGSLCGAKGTYVVPGNAAMSLLLQKLAAPPVCGAVMPLGGVLPPAELEQLTDWIAAGALNN